jgi:hypothetical protein
MKTKKVKDENMDFNPYEVDKLARVPSWIKILLLKYWAAAAACFLLFGASELGLNVYSDSVDGTVKLIMLLGLFFTILMNYPIRVIIRLMYNRRNNTYRYNMINMKGLKTFPLALVYNFIIAVIAFIIIVDVLSPNGLVFDPFGTTGGIGIEPFTVGFIYLFVDGIFVLIKNLIYRLWQIHVYKKQINTNIKIEPQLGE